MDHDMNSKENFDVRGTVREEYGKIARQGALCCAGRKSGLIPGFAVKPFDTTGAGDVFHAGFIHGLLEEWELERSLRFAAAAAALSTRKLSGRGGIPELMEVNKLTD